MRSSISLPLDRTAALFIDLQEEHRRDARLLAVGYEAVLNNVAQIQAACRAASVPLFHFAYVVDPAAATTRRFHPRLPDGRSAFSDKDDPLTAICPEVAPLPDERLIVKTEASAFGSGLSDELKANGVEWLIVCGVWTEACVDATVKDALKRDFRVLLVKDACGSGSVAMHQAGVLNLANRLYGGGVCDTAAACRLLAGDLATAWSPQSPVPIRYETETLRKAFDDL
jgi:maleamate amidohydrolase